MTDVQQIVPIEKRRGRSQLNEERIPRNEMDPTQRNGSTQRVYKIGNHIYCSSNHFPKNHEY